MRIDTSTSWFQNHIQNHRLVNIEPNQLVLTWKNGRIEVDIDAKRLDRFLLVEYLLGATNFCNSWVESVSIFDHLLIVLCLEKDSLIPHYPFKYC